MRLQRRLFAWFGVSIFMTGVVVSLVLVLLGPSHWGGWQRQVAAARHFVGSEFALVWDDPVRRDGLAARAEASFDVDIVLEDAARQPLRHSERACHHGDFSSAVERDGALLGYVRICGRPGSRHWGGGPWPFALVLLAAGATLWAASGFIARRLVWPLGELVRVTEQIGAGNLAARSRIDRRRAAEIGVVGEAINRMADRIEKQIGDQRELLAAVSHELRSPLARVRLLLELARARDAPEDTLSKLDEIEKEVVEIDALVGELLASSRLDFAAIDVKPLDARDVASRSLERAGLPATLLVLKTDDTRFGGDPTLVARALSNLLDNARRHGGGATALVVSGDASGVEFTVEDGGPGFLEQDLPRVFDSFVRRERRKESAGSLGLGLALVRRIALAHGGRVWAENRGEGGARVGMRLARNPDKVEPRANG